MINIGNPKNIWWKQIIEKRRIELGGKFNSEKKSISEEKCDGNSRAIDQTAM